MAAQDKPDAIYATARDTVPRFAFDAHVASVFKDMVNRSVPGYQTALGMIGVFASRYAKDGSNLYDLGCSLGASTLMLRHQIKARDCKIIGIDNSEAMIERCNINIHNDSGDIPVELLCADIRDVEYRNASLITLNFTLQFLPVDDRLPLLKKLYKSLTPGGALVIAEKVRLENEFENQWATDLHHQFKMTNGYSEMEVAQKRSAIENVLVPETLSAHHERLREAGFQELHNWYQCLNFAGLIAVSK